MEDLGKCAVPHASGVSSLGQLTFLPGSPGPVGSWSLVNHAPERALPAPGSHAWQTPKCGNTPSELLLDDPDEKWSLYCGVFFCLKNEQQLLQERRGGVPWKAECPLRLTRVNTDNVKRWPGRA